MAYVRLSPIRWAFIGMIFVSCLPKDTRPAPGSVNVTVTADTTVLGGDRSLLTVDGWTVSYDRFLISLQSSLGGDTTCSTYYNDGYSRILDMGVSGSQKLNLLYALGHCDFDFHVQSSDPDPYQPLGKNVTLADKSFMGTAGLDPYVESGDNGAPQPTGVALYAKGTASKGGVTKTFAWSFRQRVRHRNCVAYTNRGVVPTIGDGAIESGARESGTTSGIGDGEAPTEDAHVVEAPPGHQGIDLVSGQTSGFDIRIHGESLFLDSIDTTKAEPRFDALAAADDEHGNGNGNGNGDITLSELGQVRLADIGIPGRYFQPANAPSITPNASVWTTLEDFVYLGLYPLVARFEDTGTCDMSNPAD